MAGFKEGDRVKVKGRNLFGTVDEMADGTAYLIMSNGVEMDFPVEQLEADLPKEAPKKAGKPADDIPDDVYAEIIDDRTNIIASVQFNAIAAAFQGSDFWDTVPNRQRLNFVASLLGRSNLADGLLQDVRNGRLSRSKIGILLAIEFGRNFAAAKMMAEQPDGPRP